VREAQPCPLQALLDHVKMGTIAQEPPKSPTNSQLTRGTLPKQGFLINKNALLGLITLLLRRKSVKVAQLGTNVRLKGCQLWRIAQLVHFALPIHSSRPSACKGSSMIRQTGSLSLTASHAPEASIAAQSDLLHPQVILPLGTTQSRGLHWQYHRIRAQ
jgi:hypothetical protein